MSKKPTSYEQTITDMDPVSESTIQPIVRFIARSCSIDKCNDLVLTRGYICRRPLNRIPFAFDYLAHSALLFDAHSVQQSHDMQKTPEVKVKPQIQFMFERLGDHKDPETGVSRPYFEIREVDIGKTYKLWYQKSETSLENQRVSQALWEIDGRSYECFELDGYRYTKQIRGSAYNLTLDSLKDLAKEYGRNPYDLAHNSCHDARESIMQAVGVETLPQRPFTRITNYLRPPVSALHLSSTKVSASTEES